MKASHKIRVLNDPRVAPEYRNRILRDLKQAGALGGMQGMQGIIRPDPLDGKELHLPTQPVTLRKNDPIHIQIAPDNSRRYDPSKSGNYTFNLLFPNGGYPVIYPQETPGMGFYLDSCRVTTPGGLVLDNKTLTLKQQ